MIIFDEIRKKAAEFDRLCREHRVSTLYAFGSSTNSGFDHENSDIDLLVDVDIKEPIARGEGLLSLWNDLETFFNRKVDLLTGSSIRNPYLKKSIDATKVLIYDGSKQEIFV